MHEQSNPATRIRCRRQRAEFHVQIRVIATNSASAVWRDFHQDRVGPRKAERRFLINAPEGEKRVDCLVWSHANHNQIPYPFACGTIGDFSFTIEFPEQKAAT